MNTSFRLAPWADLLFAMDEIWWRRHIAEVREVFRGDLVTSSQAAKRHGVHSLGTMGVGWNPFGNSGAGAISLSIVMGARRVMLLGYDCKVSAGKVHWHGDHPKGMGNAGSMHKWPGHFAEVRARWPHMDIVNCSRNTALKTFPRMELETALEGAP